MADLTIYGATGYTGRLASEFAKSLGLQFTVAGRSESKLKALAACLGVEYRIFRVEDSTLVDASLQGLRVLLNCSGPFLHTAKPLIEACIRNGVHYLDIAAELDSYELCEQKHEEAKKANIMLLPGCGGSVAMLGCLADYMFEHVTNPISIDIALHVAGPMSRGSAISAAENLTSKCLHRLNGKLVDQGSGHTMQFDFDDGRGGVSCFPATLPDLITLWRSTNIPNIKTFVHVAGGAFPTDNLDSLQEGPTAEQRETNPYHVAAIVTSSDGTTNRGVLHIVNGYTFTPLASVEAVRRVLMGEAKPGFQTTSNLFGYRFAESIAGSRFRNL
ncbi:hypothetical protein M441DRAFT_283694 [Trichoderma asperellum CBS 433.97]|uniref:Saccharopine dehydrogenase NADP binding domain-containing protein n=1 Tax=Trichoderma asperellum (strain ATCC 204424 / CBS 433.97 / NBRC 101777) TaxID=1042311 RepID=A0A2T3YUA3_TRIA4|nr:hypothetical protein M441DRAFT_283694 [Trichoderma asperellum CBS 433.97]PTB36138.1 hypothetical protein M441DRAFT_283694 [Trichoderma asperellum CBS 433.97]